MHSSLWVQILVRKRFFFFFFFAKANRARLDFVIHVTVLIGLVALIRLVGGLVICNSKAVDLCIYLRNICAPWNFVLLLEILGGTMV